MTAAPTAAALMAESGGESASGNEGKHASGNKGKKAGVSEGENAEHPDDGKDGHWMCMCGSTNQSTWWKNETDAWGKDEEEDHGDRWVEEKDDEHEGPDRWGKDDEGSLEPCMCGSVTGHWEFIGSANRNESEKAGVNESENTGGNEGENAGGHEDHELFHEDWEHPD